MDPVSPLPAIACLLLAVATAFLLMKKFGAPPVQGRFATIDGLRGYLAFFVFLHHSSIWYFYLHTGWWKGPPSNLYTHFGQSSVLVFFMITGFLFFSKLIDGRTKSIDWGKLFVSRFLRLVPLYLFLMLLLFTVVAFLSNGTLNEPIPNLLNEVMQWLSFTILGAPNLNGIPRNLIIVAGVTWSLPYEWLFYCSLPLLALSVRVIPPFRYIAFSIVSVTGVIIFNPKFHYLEQMSAPLLSFSGGIAAAFAVRSVTFCRFAAHWTSSIVLLGCIVLTIAVYPYIPSIGRVPLFLLSVAFILIAGGNTLFGILVHPVSRTLGEMAYSIYLLHGITLFVFFNFVLGIPASRVLTPLAHWLLIAGTTPVLITACFFTFRIIESPAMHSTSAFTDWLRARLTLRSNSV